LRQGIKQEIVKPTALVTNVDPLPRWVLDETLAQNAVAIFRGAHAPSRVLTGAPAGQVPLRATRAVSRFTSVISRQDRNYLARKQFFH
jgi:hypothetical protein